MTEKGQVESRPKVVKNKVASIEKLTDAISRLWAEKAPAPYPREFCRRSLS